MKESGQLHAPLAVHMGKDNFVIVESKSGWSPEPVSTLWRRKKVSCLCRESNHDSWLVHRSLVTILTRTPCVYFKQTCLIGVVQFCCSNQECSQRELVSRTSFPTFHLSSYFWNWLFTVVTCTTRFHIKKFYFLLTECLSVFWKDLRTNGDYNPILY